MPRSVIKRQSSPDWFEGANWHNRYREDAANLENWRERADWWLNKEMHRAFKIIKPGDELTMKSVADLHQRELDKSLCVTQTAMADWLSGKTKAFSHKAVALIAAVEGWTQEAALRFLQHGILPDDEAVEIIEIDIVDRARRTSPSELPELLEQVSRAIAIAANRLNIQPNADLPLATDNGKVPVVMSDENNTGKSMCTSGAYLSFLLSERGFNPRSDSAIRDFVSRSMANQVPADRMRLLVADQAQPTKGDWSAIAQTLNVIDGIEEDGEQEPWDRSAIMNDFAEYKTRNLNNTAK